MIFGVSGFGTGLNSARDITETNVHFQWTDPTCNGTQVAKQCTMFSATLLYPITLENGTVTIIAESATSVDHIQPVGLPSEYFEGHDPDTNTFSTLGGVAFVAQNLFNPQATQFLNLIQLNGSLASQYMDDYGTGNFGCFATQDACAMNWRDPTDGILNALNEIMFRAALAASDVSKFAFMNLNYEDTTSFYETWPVNISTRDTQVCQYLKCCKCSRRPTLQYSNQTALI